MPSHQSKPTDGGKLRIGDDWNAIRIIALSQSNPLKAIAEFVENSIDARARSVVITRGRESGAHYLSIKDDGDGVPRDDEGLPNFKYVATHICDSIKRHLKTEGKGSGKQSDSHLTRVQRLFTQEQNGHLEQCADEPEGEPGDGQGASGSANWPP